MLPPTIIDQVRLWELERDRFKFNDGVLYSQFLSQGDFVKLRDYARVCTSFLNWCTSYYFLNVLTKVQRSLSLSICCQQNEFDQKKKIFSGKGLKHCVRKRKCGLPAFLPFPTRFSNAYLSYFSVGKCRTCNLERAGLCLTGSSGWLVGMSMVKSLQSSSLITSEIHTITEYEQASCHWNSRGGKNNSYSYFFQYLQ